MRSLRSRFAFDSCRFLFALAPSAGGGVARYTETWNARDERGAIVPPGDDLVRLSADGRWITRRVVLVP